MLDGAFTSPKIRRLAVILGIPWPQAIGLCGLLWRFTAKHAPTGEIGRHDDEEIAAALEWPGDASEVLEAMLTCRLLDGVSGPVRFVVHDWPDHAPRYVLSTLKRKGMDYSDHYRRQSNGSAVGTTVGTALGSTFSSSSSSSSTSTNTNTPTAVAGECEGIFDLWLDARRIGRSRSIKMIRSGIASLERAGVPRDEAIERIRDRTATDADAYRKLIESGDTELRFVPTAINYFRLERWNDEETETLDAASRAKQIDSEIERVRKDLG